MNETLVVVETFTTDTVSAVQDMLSRGQSLAYIVAALLFILALAGLQAEEARCAATCSASSAWW